MSAFDLAGDHDSASLMVQARMNPIDLSQPAGFFSGMGRGAVTGVGRLLADTQRTTGLALGAVAGSFDILTGDAIKVQEKVFEHIVAPADKLSRYLAPKPEEIGMAGQLLHGLIKIGGEAVAFGAPGVLVNETVAGTMDALDKGVDLQTAAKVGGVQGAAMTAGVIAPMTLGASGLGMNVLYGAGINLAQGVFQRGATSQIYENAGRHDLALQFKAMDGEAMAVDAILGAAFAGGGRALQLRGEKAKADAVAEYKAKIADLLKPEQIDAALVKNEQLKMERSGFGLPADLASRDAHVENMRGAIDDLIEGRPVTMRQEVGDMLPDEAAAKVQADVAEVLRPEVAPIAAVKYAAGQKYHAKIPEVTTVKVAELKRMNSGEVATVANDVAAQMNFSEPIKVSVFADGEMRIVDGHHRVAAARQRGMERLPVELQAINARGEVLQRLIDDSTSTPKVGVDATAANDPALDPWNEPAAPRTFEQRIADESIRAELLRMKSETGWAEVGGRMIRQQDAGGNETITRTAWVPNAEWWPGRPKGLKESEVQKAIDKAVAGEKLKPAERKVVEYMADVAEQRQKSAAFKPFADELAESGLASHNELDVAMTARAAEINPDAVEALAIRYESDDAGFMRSIKELLDEHDRQAAASRQEGQRTPDATAGQPDPGTNQQPAALRPDAVIPLDDADATTTVAEAQGIIADLETAAREQETGLRAAVACFLRAA